MLTVVLFTVVLTLASGMQTAQRKEAPHTKMSFNQAYKKFKPEMESEHLLVSSNNDAKKRVRYFRKAKKNIEAINEDSAKSYIAEFNEFAFMTDAEKSSFRGLNVSRTMDLQERKLNKRKRRSVEKRATETNWYPDHVTAVKNQGSCGSCWSFAGIAVLESRAYLNGGALRQYSEQEIVDCNSSGSECAGGWYTTVWSYVKSNSRLASTASYGYAGVKGTCATGGVSSSLDMLITSYDDAGGWSEADLVDDLAGGPVAIAINANDNFMDYAEGIFNEAIDASPNHAVVAVGYASTYFYVRNSWGSGWGDAGYVKLARGICTSLTYSYYSAHIVSLTAAKKLEVE